MVITFVKAALQTVDPVRAMIAAGVMLAVGICIILVRHLIRRSNEKRDRK